MNASDRAISGPLLLVVLALFLFACQGRKDEQNTAEEVPSAPAAAATPAPDFDAYSHLFGLNFHPLQGEIAPTCYVRGDREFGACPHCLVACLRVMGQERPRGLYMQEDFVQGERGALIRAAGDEVRLNESWVVGLQDGRISRAQKTGLTVLPLHEAATEELEQRQREAELLDRPPVTTAFVMVEPSHPWLLFLELYYTATQAGLETEILYPRAEEITSLELRCFFREGAHHLFETGADGEPLAMVDESGGQRLSWYCRPDADPRGGQAGRGETLNLDLWKPSPQISLKLEEPVEEPSVLLQIGSQGIGLISVDAQGTARPLSPVDGCPDGGATFCLLGDAPQGQEELGEVLKRYSLERITAELQTRAEEISATQVVVTVSPQVPSAVVFEAILAVLEVEELGVERVVPFMEY